MRERDIDQRKFANEESDKDDVELDGNNQLDLDSEYNDDNLESDLELLSNSEDRAGSAEDFQ